MPTIVEGALTFTFQATWQAKKYDDWTFYRRQFQKVCSSNVKAVDIVACSTDTAWLIEVKDYRRHKRTKAVDLANEVGKKVFDTLSGLVAAKFHANNASERDMAKKILNKSKLKVVLHLEQPSRPSKLFPRAIDTADLRKKLKKQIKAIDPHPEVLDIATTNAATHWNVR